MTVMGEDSPERWSDELRSTGRVVFPLRRRPMIWSLLLLLPCAVMFGFWVPDALDAGGPEGSSALVVIALWPIAIALFSWQFVTQRPALTVDREGIRRGRRKFMPWKDIGAIGLATGPVWGRTLPIIPKDVWAKDLTLHQLNVRDLPAFRRWLETLLDEHHQQSTISGNTW
jgi:hypothetical protein